MTDWRKRFRLALKKQRKRKQCRVPMFNSLYSLWNRETDVSGRIAPEDLEAFHRSLEEQK